MTSHYLPLAVILALCQVPATARADEACVTAYRARIQPIFNINCVACHMDASAGGGLSLQRSVAPASLIGQPSTEARMARVTPGNPDKSYLFRKLAGTHRAAGGSGERMPMGGQLSAADLKTISGWIAECKGR